MAHTPGPWTVRFETNIFAADGRLTANAGGHASTIEKDNHAVNAANARLIAAAPELLDAMKAAILQADTAMLEEHGGRRTDACWASYNRCVAAIAKAEGK